MVRIKVLHAQKLDNKEKSNEDGFHYLLLVYASRQHGANSPLSKSSCKGPRRIVPSRLDDKYGHQALFTTVESNISRDIHIEMIYTLKRNA